MNKVRHDWALESLSNLVHEVRISLTPEAGKSYELWSVPSFADRLAGRVVITRWTKTETKASSALPDRTGEG